MKSDTDLLRSYVFLNSGEAFTEIVRRNVGFLHSCILRRVGGDAHLAEDITQKVFSDFARKASALTRLTSVSGWLYVSANLASAEMVRKERRRKARESEASHMGGMQSQEGAQTWEEWRRVRDLLDDLICELNQMERDAVVLRFFSKKTYVEIAEDQSITEEGARKRVERALEKLRAKLASSGVTSSRDALENVLTEQPDSEIPHRLADRVAGIALVEFGATGAATSWLLSVVRVLTSRSAILGAGFLAASLLVTWQHHKNVLMEEQIGRLDGQAGQIPGLERENRRLSHSMLETEELRRALAENPTTVPRLTTGSQGGSAAKAPLYVNVTAEGRILWGNDPVTLQDFLDKLVASHPQDPSSEAQIIIHGEPGVAFSATAYVVEQASKAGFHDIVINSQASPGKADNWITAPSAPIPAGDKRPPMIPDVTSGP